MIRGPFAAALEQHREVLNAKFASAQHARAIDRAEFTTHLRDVVAPIIEAISRLDENAVSKSTLALYDLSLESFGASLLGGASRVPAVKAMWSELLPEIPQLLRLDARRVAGAATNALANVAAYSKDPAAWVETMRRSAKELNDIDLFLLAGRVAAWRSGLAHYRKDALDALASMPGSLASTLLSIPSADVKSSVERFQSDRWFDPASPARPGESRVAGMAGAFRGFGGRFLEVPVVGSLGGHLIVTSGEQQWELHADRFGATLLPLRGAVTPSSDLRALPGELQSQLPDPESSAIADGVLAVTLKHSFSVYVIEAA